LTARQHPADVTVVSAPKEITVYNADRVFRLPLRAAVASGASLVVADLTSVEFMDAVGLGVLTGAFKLGKQRTPQVAIGVVCSREPVLRLFRITGLSRVFDIRGAVEEFTDCGNTGREAERRAESVAGEDQDR
jgi:anti-sigma B factor antagonist